MTDHDVLFKKKKSELAFVYGFGLGKLAIGVAVEFGELPSHIFLRDLVRFCPLILHIRRILRDLTVRPNVLLLSLVINEGVSCAAAQFVPVEANVVSL